MNDQEKHDSALIEDTATPGHAATDEHGRPLAAIDAYAEGKLRRKIDRSIIPVVALLYVSFSRWWLGVAMAEPGHLGHLATSPRPL